MADAKVGTTAPDATGVCIVMTTLPSEAGASTLARAIVDAALGACVQIDAVRSVYRWQDEVCDEPEWRLTIKAATSQAHALMTFVRERHPYEVPELLCLPVQAGDPAYLGWVRSAAQ